MMNFVPYDREAAVAYAHLWAYGRNPAYYDFERIGGDCTNFASQCLYAGLPVMNYTKTFGWYYNSVNDRAPAWTGVEFLFKFLSSNKGVGPYGRLCSPQELAVGDLVQLKGYQENRFSHCPVVVGVGRRGNTPYNVLLAAHSQDADYRPLASYAYRDIRFIKVLGGRERKENGDRERARTVDLQRDRLAF